MGTELQLWLLAILAGLGFVSGFLSGMLGIGGAIILIPLLRYLSPLLGLGELDMRTVAGIAMAEAFFASALGFLAHRRRGLVSWELVLWMGSGSFLGSLGGATSSQYLPNQAFSLVFVGLAVAAAGLMFLPGRKLEEVLAGKLSFSRPLAFGIALSVGLLTGIVGVGGGFILLPVELYVLKVPIRTAVGSTLGIVFLSALAGLVGKLATGQVPFLLAGAVVVGVIPAAPLGAWVSYRLKAQWLRRILAIALAAIALRMLYGLLVGQD